jgi:ATP-dependent protease Clp ATPase subunit
VSASSTHEEACSFCRRARLEVEYLVAAADVSICESCIDSAEPHSHAENLGPLSMYAPCSFCKEHRAHAQYRMGNTRICDNCIRLCVDIRDERQPAAPLPPARLVKR